MKRKNKKIVLLLIGILVLFFVGTDWYHRQQDSYKLEHAQDIHKGDKTVTLTIRCDSILQHYDQLDPNLQSETYVPKDGMILTETNFVLWDGDTAFDILERATKLYGIQLEYRGNGFGGLSGKYIEGINFLYEFSCGKNSGWMYQVNAMYPNYGCSQYELKDKDEVTFVYTCERGKDIGGGME